jgi:hypothetical protein
MYVVYGKRMEISEGLEGGLGLFKVEFTIWAWRSGDAAPGAGKRADSHCLYLFVTTAETNLKESWCYVPCWLNMWPRFGKN